MNDYYVYELIDATNQGIFRVFYVGKGSGPRVKEHAKRVLAKVKNGEKLDGEKEIALKQLLIDGKAKPENLKELVIGRYQTEEEALAVEATLIKWIYGINTLGNKVHGHRSNQVRAKGNYDFDSELEPLGHMAQRIHNIKTRGILEQAEDLKTTLICMGFRDVKIAWKSQDFGLFWFVPNFPVVVQLKIQENNNKVVLNARPSMQKLDLLAPEKPDSKTRKSNHKEFLGLMKEAGYCVSAASSVEFAFAALFESSVKTGKIWSEDLQEKIKEITGESIQTRTSFHNGIELASIEVIGNYLRDLQIRLSIASYRISAQSQDQVSSTHFSTLIKLFQSKPGNKYFLKGAGIDEYSASSNSEIGKREFTDLSGEWNVIPSSQLGSCKPNLLVLVKKIDQWSLGDILGTALSHVRDKCPNTQKIVFDIQISSEDWCILWGQWDDYFDELVKDFGVDIELRLSGEEG